MMPLLLFSSLKAVFSLNGEKCHCIEIWMPVIGGKGGLSMMN